MRLALVAFVSLGVALAAGSFGYAKTSTATLGETAQIVAGNTVSAFLVGDQIVTHVQDDSPSNGSMGRPPLLRISFDMKPSWYLVKRVTWDKAHRHLTIDF